MLADKLVRTTATQPQTHTVCHTQALCATHAPAQPLRKQGSMLTQAHANRNRRSPPYAHADVAKTGPFGLARPSPPLLLPCDLQTSRHQRGEKYNLSCSGFCSACLVQELLEGPALTPLSGDQFFFISQEPSKMLNKSRFPKNGTFWASYPPSAPGFAGLLKSWWSPFAILATGERGCF